MQSEDTDLVKGDPSDLTHLHLPIMTAGHVSCLQSNYCNYACMAFIDYIYIKTIFFIFFLICIVTKCVVYDLLGNDGQHCILYNLIPITAFSMKLPNAAVLVLHGSI